MSKSVTLTYHYANHQRAERLQAALARRNQLASLHYESGYAVLTMQSSTLDVAALRGQVALAAATLCGFTEPETLRRLQLDKLGNHKAVNDPIR